MKNLVRVRVADPAEKMRIGEGPLERVIPPPQNVAIRLKSRRDHLQTAGVVLAQGVSAPKQVKRGPPLGPSFGQQQGPFREIEGRQRKLPRKLRPRLLPLEPAGDHQVQHKPQVIFETERDAFSQPSNFPHLITID